MARRSNRGKKGLAGLLTALVLGVGGYVITGTTTNVNLPYANEVMEVAQKLGVNLPKFGNTTNTNNTNNSASTSNTSSSASNSSNQFTTSKSLVNASDLPKWDGTADGITVTLNKNNPNFTKAEIGDTSKGWVKFASLDSVKGSADKTGRAHQADALLTTKNMPTGERGSIASVTPTGWNTMVGNRVKGWNTVKGNVSILGKKQAFWNRGHLIAYSLTTDEGKPLNAIAENLTTQARYTNMPGMTNFEGAIRDYLKAKGNDNAVRYQVRAIYNGNELVPRAYQVRALSIDLGRKDNRKLSYNALLHNDNPGWKINYATGDFTQN